jgi:hypothetical protein
MGVNLVIEVVWSRILECEGKSFKQIGGKEFTYKVKGNSIALSTTNRLISKGTFEKALIFVPLESTMQVQHLQAPSYLFSILMDSQNRKDSW